MGAFTVIAGYGRKCLGVPLGLVLCLTCLHDCAAQAKGAATPEGGVARSASANQGTYTLSLTARQVVVDVVVTGTDGAPVSGLTSSNFQVYEDGVRQALKGFDEHSPKLDRSDLPPANLQLPADTFVNLEKVSSSGPLCVVLLDELNTTIDYQMYAYQQILELLRRKDAGTPVAIFLLGDRFEMLQGFTADRDRLIAAMKRPAAKPKLTAMGGDLDFDDPDGHTTTDPGLVARRFQAAQMTLDSFIEIGKFLAAVPGRKNLLWFSRSFDAMPLSVDEGEPAESKGSVGSNREPPSFQPKPNGQFPHMAESAANFNLLVERLRKVTAELAVSQTAVYPIDERGLFTDPGDSAAVATCAGAGDIQGGCKHVDTVSMVKARRSFVDTVDGEHATMLQIAEATGGKAFYNTNDLVRAGLKALDSGASYYTLSYIPRNTKYDGSMRHIEVRLRSNHFSGAHLSYRRTYIADDPKTLAPVAIWSDPMDAALMHGAPEAQSIVFKVQVDPENSDVAAQLSGSPVRPDSALNSKEEQRSKDRGESAPRQVQTYDLRISVLMGDQLKFTQAADGIYRGALDLAAVAYAADGRRLGGTRQHLDVSMPSSVFRKSVEDGFFHRMSVSVPVDATALRVAVRDSSTGGIGAIEIALPLADVPVAKQAN